MNSKIKFSGVQWKDAAVYVGVNSTPKEWDVWGVREWIPKRSKKYGPRPGMTSADVMNPESGVYVGYQQQ